ncbi:MAG: hypothetical protein HDT25_08300 [Ruminococcus sp.]|nr:hypothetical protein [Ruminococcus sp.]
MQIKKNPNIHPMDVTFDWKKTDLDSLDLIDCTYLGIWYHSSKQHDFFNLPTAPKLKKLFINFSNSETILGIEKYPCLESLELYHVSKLKTIEGLEKLPMLKSLHIFNASKVTDFRQIGKLHQIESLRICDSGCIENLNFIASLKNLTDFSFGGSNVVDGNLYPLLDENLKLKWCGCDNKRHYTHKMEEINSVLSLRFEEDN